MSYVTLTVLKKLLKTRRPSSTQNKVYSISSCEDYTILVVWKEKHCKKSPTTKALHKREQNKYITEAEYFALTSSHTANGKLLDNLNHAEFERLFITKPTLTRQHFFLEFSVDNSYRYTIAMGFFF